MIAAEERMHAAEQYGLAVQNLHMARAIPTDADAMHAAGTNLHLREVELSEAARLYAGALAREIRGDHP